MYLPYLIAPGGTIIAEGEKPKTTICVFEANEDSETLKSHVQVTFLTLFIFCQSFYWKYGEHFPELFCVFRCIKNL